MAFYKVNVLTMEAHDGAQVFADATIQVRVSRNPDVFKEIGHRTVVLGAAEVLAITDDAVMTAPQKRAALRDLVKAKVLAMGIDIADEAWTDFITLVPPPFEVTVRDV
jgi:hypothetical protein